MRFISTPPIIFIFIILVTLHPLCIQYLYSITKPSHKITFTIRILKLIRFTFTDNLSPDQSLSLLYLISFTCLLLEIKHERPPQRGHKSILSYKLKALILALITKLLGNRQYMNSHLIFALCGCHLYLMSEIILAMCAALVQTMGIETQAQFDDPCLSISLQNFWGRRWNLGTSMTLREKVYVPIRRICTPVLGRNWAVQIGIVATFFISGLMHETIYAYLSQTKPNWEVTRFFVLQGVCMVLEILVKEMVGNKWKLHPAMAKVFTVGFVAATSYRLIYTPIVRYGMCMRMMWELIVPLRYTKDASLWMLI